MTSPENFFYKSNRLQQVRGFYYTMSLGSVSKAAERMGLQQSAVSMQIKSLERDLGVTLFMRNGPQIIPTSEAHALYEIALPHIEGMDSLPDRFHKTLVELNTKNIVLAANQTSMTYLLPPMIGTCKAAFKDIAVTIKTLNLADAVDQLRRDEIQAFVGAAGQLSPEFDFFPLARHETILIARPDHPLIVSENFKLSDISAYPVVRCLPEFITVPMFEDIMRAYHVPLYVMLVHGDWEIFKSFVAHSDAFTMVSRLCYDPKRDTHIGIRSMAGLIPDVQYGIVVKRGKYLPPPLAFMVQKFSKV
jgi:DNA-binding transcriptional LysR family regulator